MDGVINMGIYPWCPQAFPDLHLMHNTWQHLCLVADGRNMLLHLDNETNSKVMTMSECNVDTKFTDSVTVLVGTDSGKFAYSGEVTGVRYYDRQLTTSEVQELLNCESSAENHIQIKEVFTTGNVSIYRLGGQDKLCLPEDKEFMAVFTICSDHPTAESLCTKLGSRLIGKDDDFGKLAKEAVLSLDVPNDDLYLWTDIADKEQGSVLSINRDTGNHLLVNYTSETVLHVTACMMPLKKTAYMKDHNTQKMTLLKYNRRLVLLSEHGEIVRREPCPDSKDDEGFSRCLAKRFFGMQEEYTRLDYGEDMFGRHTWNEENTDKYRNLSISFCEKDKFSCNDGSCIPLQERCDGIRHCKDNSDEGELCTLVRPLPPSYVKTYCPKSTPVVGLRINVIKVNSVLLDMNEFKITINVVLQWRDDRLTFQHLLKEPKILQSHEYKGIWTPHLFFPNAIHEDNVAVSTKTSVLNDFTVKVKGKGYPEIYDSYEGECLLLLFVLLNIRNKVKLMVFNGSDVEINNKIQYQFTFSCTFDFVFFPFDIQQCWMKVCLRKTYACCPRWDTSEGGVKVTGNESTLSMYNISKARYDISGEGRCMTVHLLFTRKFESYVMTTFFPCIILCFLAHATLTHFRIENFNDRIMVTLSLLIVLASLFSQLSSTLPNSPSAKLIDYFFLYCIGRVSLIFLLHTFIEVSRRSTADTEEEPTSVIKGLDPTLGIKMKLAWVSGENVTTKEPPKRRINIPRTLSYVGAVAVLVMDVVMAVFFLFKTIDDHNKKSNHFHALNVTE
ncbi:uncharacterized protein LOC123501463 [Portunus trituberculatus]|uniref:uncharacterized protein LOC123501463 n=1 Tax=Portunus trituberculatus TaxID=210409 RepID=UPI001E1D1F26|nr:uncharacterized protein LOC123501463 [Portunus trituberculatus]